MTRADEILLEFQDGASNQPVQRWEPDAEAAQAALTALQAPENSMLGALLRTGGFSIAGGKLKLLGSHQDAASSLLAINQQVGQDITHDYLIVAYDIYGNVYAINVGYAPAFRPGEIIAFYSDGTDWESTADGLLDFLSHCFEGDLTGTFRDFETGDDALEEEAKHASARVINYYPPLYTKEASPAASSKRLVGLVESLNLRRKLASLGLF